MSGATILHEYLPGIAQLDKAISKDLGEGLLKGGGADASPHVIMALFATVLVLFLGIRYAMHRKAAEDSAIPEHKLNARSIVEVICDTALGMMEGVMGKEDARAFLPLIGSMAFFILCGNLLGLVPGLLPPTDVISTNIVLALIVFFATHIYGIRKNGFEHIKHMMGPMWWLAWLIFPIELISHIARPMSLTLRLFGNMVGDHTALTIVLGFGLLVPIPVMILGVIVCVVQTLVFCLLSTVYIGMAVEDLHAHH